MKVVGSVNITSNDGVNIEGRTNDDLVAAGGGVVTISSDNELLNFDNELHFKPTEIIFSSSSYNLTSKSKFVILIYDGPHMTTNVTMDLNKGQTVYIVNKIATASVVTPLYTIEGDKQGVKYFCSEQLSQWFGMGIFDFFQ